MSEQSVKINKNQKQKKRRINVIKNPNSDKSIPLAAPDKCKDSDQVSFMLEFRTCFIILSIFHLQQVFLC